MNNKAFTIAVTIPALIFFIIFCSVVVPPLIAQPDIIAAFAAGFVNPYAAGYSSDVLACWAILAVWVVFEANKFGVRYGWVCLLVGAVPGVAVGFAAYLVLRAKQLPQPS